MPEITSSRYLRWHRQGREKCCVACGQTKLLAEFYAYGYRTNQGKRSIRYESRCKPCARARRRENHAANPNYGAAQSLKWRTKNKDQQRTYARAYRVSEHGRQAKALLQRTRKARQRAGIVGHEEDQAIRAIYLEATRIEALAEVCPVFDDPLLTKKMHVDHIMPLSKGGKHVATNLQILPAGLNMRKGNKCPR